MNRLSISRSIVFFCDIQESFRFRLPPSPRAMLYQRCNFLSKACKILQIPRIVTEQYPKGLGKTVSNIDLENLPDSPVHIFPKTKFSMLTDDVEQILLRYPERDQILLVGIEAHICVLQTVLDLAAKSNYEISVLSDAVLSQRAYDREVALDRMKSLGVNVTTTESAVFDLLKDSMHPSFKAISELLKSDPFTSASLED